MLAFHAGTAGHPEVTAGLRALTDRGRRGGFLVDPTQNASDFNAMSLGRYRAVVFLNTAADRLNNEREGALADNAAAASSGSARRPRPSRARLSSTT